MMIQRIIALVINNLFKFISNYIKSWHQSILRNKIAFTRLVLLLFFTIYVILSGSQLLNYCLGRIKFYNWIVLFYYSNIFPINSNHRSDKLYKNFVCIQKMYFEFEFNANNISRRIVLWIQERDLSEGRL